MKCGGCGSRAARWSWSCSKPALASSLLEVGLGEAEVHVLELLAHPFLGVGQEVDHQQAPAGHEDPARLGERAHRLLGVVQRLAHHDHVVRGVGQRQVLDLALDRLDVRDPALLGPRA